MMTLSEAIKEVKRLHEENGGDLDWKAVFNDVPLGLVATILNAVVKGELK